MCTTPSRLSALSPTCCSCLLFVGTLVAVLSDNRRVGADTVTQSETFTGPNQVALSTATADGTIEVFLQSNGSLFGSPFVLDPNPQTKSYTLDPDPTIVTTNPQTISPVEFDFDNRTLQLLDIRNMNLDALNGGVVPFHFSEVDVDVLLNGATPDSFDLTRGGDAVGLTFEQSGPANITGNTFQLPVVMTLDEVQATHVLDESVQIKSNVFTTRRNMTMTGTVAATPQGGGPIQDVLLAIQLDALILGDPQFGFTNTINVVEDDFSFQGENTFHTALSLNVALDLQTIMPQFYVVPEPAAFGLMAVAGLWLALWGRPGRLRD